MDQPPVEFVTDQWLQRPLNDGKSTVRVEVFPESFFHQICPVLGRFNSLRHYYKNKYFIIRYCMCGPNSTPA